MQRYLDVTFNTIAWSISQPVVYYPMLIVLAFSVIVSIGFLIKYVCRM